MERLPLIFFWSCSRPYSSASAVGGQPGLVHASGKQRHRNRAQ